jgi:hypothetical protein
MENPDIHGMQHIEPENKKFVTIIKRKNFRGLMFLLSPF